MIVLVSRLHEREVGIVMRPSRAEVCHCDAVPFVIVMLSPRRGSCNCVAVFTNGTL